MDNFNYKKYLKKGSLLKEFAAKEEPIVESVIEDVNNEVVATDETILDQLEGVGKQTDPVLSTEVFHNLNFVFFKNII